MGVSDWTVTDGNIDFCGYTAAVQQGITIFQKTIDSLPSHYKFEMDLRFIGLEGFTGNTLNIYYDGISRPFKMLQKSQNHYLVTA